MRRLLGWFVALVLLVGGLFLADEPARGWAESYAADRLQAQVPLDSRPRVEIDGDPFLWRLAQRDFPRVRVHGAGLPVTIDDADITAHDVDLTVTGVTASASALNGDRAQGTARLPLTELSKLVGQPLSYAGDGRLQSRVRQELIGVQLDVTVSVEPVLDAAQQTVRLTDPRVQVDGAGGLGAAAVERIAQERVSSALSRPIELPSLTGLRVEGMDVAEDGVHLRFGGANVSVPIR